MKVTLGYGSNGGVVITSNSAIGESLNPSLSKEMEQEEFNELIKGTLEEVELKVITLLKQKDVYPQK